MSGVLIALLAIQKECPTLQKSALNPHFKSKYVPLDKLHEAVMPLVNKHGCVWVTCPTHHEDGSPALFYSLVHAESEQKIEGTMPLLLAKQDPQGQGSAITYARRYALMAVLGLVADEDDDGNAGSRPRESSQTTAAGNGAPRGTAAYPLGPAPPNERISDGQAKRAYAIRKQLKWSDHDYARLLDHFEIHKDKELHKHGYNDFVAYLERKKQLPPETDVPADMDGLEPQPVGDTSDLPFS